MKKLSTTLIVFFLGFTLFGQDIEGKWQGLLKVQGMELTIVFNISQEDDTLIATMDSPDQGAFGLAVQDISFQDNRLNIGMNMPPIQYEGTLKPSGEIDGTFKQSGYDFPLILSQEEVKNLIKRNRKNLLSLSHI